MTEPEKGASFVPQINAAYAEVVALGMDKAPLEKAIKLGGLLKLAKEAVGRGKFMSWLERNCPKVSQRTANVYMQVADRADHLRANWQHAAKSVGEGGFSIRSALKEFRTPEQKARAEAAAVKRRATLAERRAREAEANRGSVDAALDGLAPDEVFKALRDSFDDEGLKALLDLLSKYLASRVPQVPSPPLQPIAVGVAAGGFERKA
jgi:hypothetical protein